MKTRQLTTYNDSPTFNMLSELDQMAYRQNGTIHPADEEPPKRSGIYKGRGNMWVSREEMEMLQGLFLATYITPVDRHVSTPMFLLKSQDYGIVKIEVFHENYLIECKDMFYEAVAIRLLSCRQQVEIVGDNNLISVTRRQNKQTNL